MVSFASQAVDDGMKKEGNKARWPKYWPSRLGIWEGSIGCTAKSAIGGSNINKQLIVRTGIPIWN